MKLEDLNEEYNTAFTDDHRTYVEIYTNPSRRELGALLKSIGKKVRVIIDDRKRDVHVFTARSLHEYAAEELGLPYDDDNPRILEGEGVIQSGKVFVETINKVNHGSFDVLEDISNGNWQWTKRFLDYDHDIAMVLKV